MPQTASILKRHSKFALMFHASSGYWLRVQSRFRTNWSSGGLCWFSLLIENLVTRLEQYYQIGGNCSENLQAKLCGGWLDIERRWWWMIFSPRGEERCQLWTCRQQTIESCLRRRASTRKFSVMFQDTKWSISERRLNKTVIPVSHHSRFESTSWE